MSNGDAVVDFGSGEVALPLHEGTENERALDINRLRGETGLITLDHGFANTAAATSAVSYVDGEAGMLRYREFGIDAPEYEPMTFYSSDVGEEDPAAFLAGLHGSYQGDSPVSEPIG